jgi:hypothetical protein
VAAEFVYAPGHRDGSARETVGVTRRLPGMHTGDTKTTPATTTFAALALLFGVTCAGACVVQSGSEEDEDFESDEAAVGSGTTTSPSASASDTACPEGQEKKGPILCPPSGGLKVSKCCNKSQTLKCEKDADGVWEAVCKD